MKLHLIILLVLVAGVFTACNDCQECEVRFVDGYTAESVNPNTPLVEGTEEYCGAELEDMRRLDEELIGVDVDCE